jgi:hypothetical protein
MHSREIRGTDNRRGMAMSDEEDLGIGEHFVDTFYEAGQAIGDLVTGDFDGAQENFLDMSRDALDTISDGGFSHLVDRMNEDTGLDMREELTDGLQSAGEAIGDAVYDGVQAVGDAVDYVEDAAGDAYDAVSDFVSDVF